MSVSARDAARYWPDSAFAPIHHKPVPEHFVARSASPGTHAADPLDGDVGDVAGRRIIHRRELDLRSEIHARQGLEQFRRAALGDARTTVDDYVLVEADLVASPGFDRQHDPGIPANVAELAVLRQMARHDLVTIEADPHDRDLRPPV